MTKNDMASLAHNDGGAAKTRVDGEGAAGDPTWPPNEAVRLVYEMLCDDSYPPNPEEHWEGWMAGRIVEALDALNAEALTSLRTERDEARATGFRDAVSAVQYMVSNWALNSRDRSRGDALIEAGRELVDELVDASPGDWLGTEWKSAQDWMAKLSVAEARALKAEAENKALRQALEPFAKIVPSSFYAADGSEGEGYRIYLEAQPQHIAFTGSDIAKAREAILPPSESQ